MGQNCEYISHYIKRLSLYFVKVSIVRIDNIDFILYCVQVQEARFRSQFDDSTEKLKSPQYSPRSLSPTIDSELLDDNRLSILYYNDNGDSEARRSPPPPQYRFSSINQKEIKRQHWLDRLKHYQVCNLCVNFPFIEVVFKIHEIYIIRMKETKI